MTVFDGARDDMLTDEPCPIRMDRLARMAEAGNWLCETTPIRRRHRYGQALARWAALIGGVAAAAWLVSDMAVLALLDEGRLAAIGIGP